MKNKFYDVRAFNYAIECINEDPKEAEQRLADYLKRFPFDRTAIAYHAHVLIVLNRLFEAEQVVNRLEQLIRNSTVPETKHKEDMVKFIKTKVALLCYQKKFEELYAFLNDNFQVIKAQEGENFNMGPAYFWCLVNLGLVDTSNRIGYKTSESDGNTYEYRQMIKYSDEDFLEHVKKHIDSTMGNPRVFIPDFPFGQVIEEVKKKISKEEGLNSNFNVTKYVFRYPGCGIIKEEGKDNTIRERKTDYFIVVVLHGTTNIITVYPASKDSCSRQPNVIDLSYLLAETPVIGPRISKTPHQPSRVERFNKRFGLKQ